MGVRTEAGTSFPILVSQMDGSCGSSRRLLSGRRVQSISSLSVEVSVDVSKTALTSFSSNAEQAVRTEIETAFSQNPSFVDSLFASVTAAACSAQGIPTNMCPNSPSLALSTSGGTTSSHTETRNDLVPVIAGAIGGVAFVAAVMALWKAKSSRHSKQAPSPDTPGLVIRQLAAVPSAPPADDPGFPEFPSSKRFGVQQQQEQHQQHTTTFTFHPTRVVRTAWDTLGEDQEGGEREGRVRARL
jgi:hypothetical protein